MDATKLQKRKIYTDWGNVEVKKEFDNLRGRHKI